MKYSRENLELMQVEIIHQMKIAFSRELLVRKKKKVPQLMNLHMTLQIVHHLIQI